MNPIAQQLTVWAATGIITALGGYMLGWWRGYRRKSDAMQTGVRSPAASARASACACSVSA